MDIFMPFLEQSIFKQYVNNATNYFEFGCGGSTYYCLTRDNIKTITSVESDKQWIEQLKQLDKFEKVNFIFADIGTEPNNWGYPGKNSDPTTWKRYYDAFSSINNKQDIDLILIDGRFRVACALYIHSMISNNTIIIIDDFYDRPQYWIILDFFHLIERAGRLAILKKKECVIERDILEKYNIVPE